MQYLLSFQKYLLVHTLKFPKLCFCFPLFLIKFEYFYTQKMFFTFVLVKLSLILCFKILTQKFSFGPSVGPQFVQDY